LWPCRQFWQSVRSTFPILSGYRPDIDGLRAVAVLSVVIFHAWPTVLPSGFIGVDIFFVISGFLISGIIFKGVEKNNFSFLDFYLRRIKRILPALILIIISSVCLGWFVLLADEYQMLGKHIASAALFISNFTSLNESGYFDTAAELKPLLHLWSLGIEEQFYIIWPLLIYVGARLRINLLILVVVLLLTSFSLNIWRIDAHLVQTFYLPFTRFWELLAGACLAYFVLNHGDIFKKVQIKASNFIALSGIAFVALALVLINSSKLFPGWWALLPVVGTVLLIAAGPDAWINKHLLAWRPAVFLGLISYPLYLWHWSLLSFLRITESSDPSPYLVVAVVFLSVFLAWITYFLVEVRLRHSSYHWVAVGLVVAMVFSGLAGKLLQHEEGFPERASIAHFQEYDQQMKREAPTDGACLEYVNRAFSTVLFNYCRSKNLGSLRWIAIVGDSHAHVLFPGFSEEFGKRGFGTILLANSSCPPLLGTATGKTPAERELCSRKIEQILNVVAGEKKIERVLFATRGPVYITGNGFGAAGRADTDQNVRPTIESEYTESSRDLYFNGLDRTVNYILKSNKKLDYFLENPEMGVLPKDCIGRPATFRRDRIKCEINFNVYHARMADYRSLVLRIKQKYPSLKILDPEPLFCNTKVCNGIRDNKLLFADGDHLSVEGSKYIANRLTLQFFR
jgi:peptidoglycan/LPS O-acetylase OafA/YrhL